MSHIAYTPKDAPATITKPGRVILCRNGECRLRLQFGLFFDGTNNNRELDMPSLSHSNVARLYNAAYDEPINGLNAIYIPGVGTPFPQIGEVVPHESGASMGTMGAERVRYALLAIVNEISRLLTTRLIVPESKIPEAVKLEGNLLRWNHRLTTLVAQHRQQDRAPHLDEIVLDVFGFSRGAAAARSFVNQLLRHFSPGGQFFCGVPLRLRFLGLFDTVASVGLADSVPGPFEGHQDWAAQDLLAIPPQVEQCVHFVAGHEGRKSFPIDLVLGKDGRYPPNCIEVVYPGVHSDVGGGYGPGDQGKAPDQSALLSQITLNDMYERALKAGVPLRRREKLKDARLEAEFAVSKELRRYHNLYLEAVKLEGRNYPAIRHYEKHLRYYLHWRREVLSRGRFEFMHCVRRARAQDRTNLTDSNAQFREYIAQLQHQDRTAPAHLTFAAPSMGILSPKLDTVGLAHYRKYWPQPMTLFNGGEALLDFLDLYVHDSRAGFTIIDPVTFYDHKRIQERLRQQDAAYQHQVQAYQAYQARCIALPTSAVTDAGVVCPPGGPPMRPTDPLTSRERNNLAIYNKTPDARRDSDRAYIEVPVYSDGSPGAYHDGEVGAMDVLAVMDGRREARWSYLHPRQHFACSRLTF